ncbi:hypothetical protein EVG20_g9643 [Dentipellis fragilis]|uniref:Uncharacterized protein n=1 Tax=Dentipellis fragilis TaxID=205917 RepID=A0A4Y9XZ23_9AGAM|nr:hypothetical protein EVG20_g9643 [Dentipellis fragilis]
MRLYADAYLGPADTIAGPNASPGADAAEDAEALTDMADAYTRGADAYSYSKALKTDASGAPVVRLTWDLRGLRERIGAAATGRQVLRELGGLMGELDRNMHMDADVGGCAETDEVLRALGMDRGHACECELGYGREGADWEWCVAEVGEYIVTPPLRKRRKARKTRRRARAASSSSEESVYDPYAPSTSANRL